MSDIAGFPSRVRANVHIATGARSDTGLYTLAIATILFFGLLVRLSFTLASDFPLNDGGLFYVMVRDLQQAHYALPLYTAYNNAQIPYAYPPLAFYLTAALNDITHIDLITLFRFLPVVLNMLTIVAFAHLSRTLLPSRVASVGAVFAFTFLPMAFQWQIMGGGITRALGFACALALAQQLIRLYRTGQRTYVVTTICLASLTVLSHPEAAWFAIYTGTLLWLFLGRNRRGLRHSLLLAAGTIVLTAPWWMLTVLRHGGALFRAFGESGFPWYSGLVRLLTLTITVEPGFPVLGGLALVGVIVCLRRRQFLLVLWIAAVVLLQSRAASQKVVVPLALLAGIGLSDVLLPLLNGQQWSWHGAAVGDTVRKPVARLATCALALLLIYVTFAGMAGFREQLGALSTDDRATTAWAMQNLPPQSHVLVLSSAEWWGTDRTSEWLPVLTGMESVATVQGYEWLPGFSQRIARYALVQHCVWEGPNCVTAWLSMTQTSVDYLYITKGSDDAERPVSYFEDALKCDGRFRQIYTSVSGDIYVLAASGSSSATCTR